MYNQIIALAAQIVFKWKIHPELAMRFAAITVIMRALGFAVPTIISGYREPLLQKRLLENWNAGFAVNPGVGMPATKPACDSNHSTTIGGVPASLAFDVTQSPQAAAVFPIVWKIFAGAQWGGNFATPDPNHYSAAQAFTTRNPIC